MPQIKLWVEDTWEKVVDLPFLPREDDMILLGQIPGGDAEYAYGDYALFFEEELIVVKLHLGKRDNYDILENSEFFEGNGWSRIPISS